MRKQLFCLTNIKRRNDWVHEIVDRSLAIWITAILSDESRWSLSIKSGRVRVWGLNNQDIKRLHPTVKHKLWYGVLFGMMIVRSLWSARETSLMSNMFPYFSKASFQ